MPWDRVNLKVMILIYLLIDILLSVAFNESAFSLYKRTNTEAIYIIAVKENHKGVSLLFLELI